jgi:vancomycin permeability regulator SanA
MLTLVMTVSTTMVKLTAESIVATEALPPDADYDCILVLGAGVRDDGTPSDMLYDRVSVSAKVYAALGDTPLLMSGDHTGDYNEVGVMKSLATVMGVPSEDIFLDHEGYSTYESLYRAKAVFGAKKIIIITQEYHLHRALYIARELGMEAMGVSADLRPYRLQGRYNAREYLARFKDFFTAAKGDYDGHLDPPVDLNGDGNLT